MTCFNPQFDQILQFFGEYSRFKVPALAERIQQLN